MSIDKIRHRIRENSKQDSTKRERTKSRRENKARLDLAFAIAVKIASDLKANKTANVFPKTQKEMAKAMECSPQYVNKLLRGTENLQLETITKIEQILDINLIQVVDFETIVQEQPENSQTYTIFNK